MKKTLVIGASVNPERYANIATKRLLRHNHSVVLLGLKAGEINQEPILTGKPILENIDTITLYVSAKNQTEWLDYIIETKPRRVIFNPGTENPAFYPSLIQNDIEPIEACTLVMLSVGNY